MKILFLTACYGLGEKVYEIGFKQILGNKNVQFGIIWDSRLLEYDIIFIGRDILDNKKSLLMLNYILQKLYNKVIFVVFDMFDDLLIHRKVYDKRILVYFKREIPLFFFDFIVLKRYLINLFTKFKFYNYLTYPEMIKVLKNKRIYPILFSYIENKDFTPLKEKKYLVSFIANLIPLKGNIFHKFNHLTDSWKIKKEIAKLCKKYKSSFVYLGIAWPGGGIKHTNYLNILSKSLISLSPRSASFDTARYWEIPYTGSVLVAEKPRIFIPNNFIPGKHAFFFSNLKELKKIIEFVSLNKNIIKKMGEEARNFVIKHHNPKKRAEYVLNTIKVLKDKD